MRYRLHSVMLSFIETFRKTKGRAVYNFVEAKFAAVVREMQRDCDRRLTAFE